MARDIASVHAPWPLPEHGKEDANMSRWMLTHRARVMPLMCSYSFFTSIRTFRPLFHSDVAVIVATALLLGGCGGGGDGGGGAGGGIMFSTPPDPAQYSGLTTPAALSSSNTEHFTASALGATDSGTGFTTASAGVEADSAQSPKSISVVSMVIELTQRPAAESKLRYVKGVGISALAVTTQEDIFECEDGGQLRERQEFDSVANTTTVTDEYWNCLDADGLTHGTIITRFFGNEPGRIEIEIPALRDLSGGDDLTFTGTLSALTTFPSGAQAITANLVVEDHVARDSIRIDNLELSVLTTFGPSGATQSLEIPRGRIFLSEYGYVDIHTETPLLYPGPDYVAPESGGPLVFVGAGPARVSVTPRSVTEVILALDENGDGTSERYAVLPYSALGEGAATQSAPVARIAGPTTVPHNTAAEFDGSGSSDANHDLLSFTWVVESAPSGSTATLDTSFGWKARLISDREGQYRISLVVFDGVYTSRSELVFDAVNVAPVALASGSASIAAIGDVISFDWSRSSDQNGDSISYSWSVKSRPTGSTAQVDNSNTVHPNFVPDRAGKYELALIASDGRLAGAAAIVTFGVIEDFAAICNTDVMDGIPDTGFARFPEMSSYSIGFVPTCGGWVLRGDWRLNGNQQDSVVTATNVFTGRDKSQYSLPVGLRTLAYDNSRGFLYTTYECTASLIRLNLNDGTQTPIALPGAGVDIALGDDGHVFVSYEGTASTGPLSGIALIDGITGKAIADFPQAHARFIAFDQTHKTLLAARAFNPGALVPTELTTCPESFLGLNGVTRYRFDSSILSLVDVDTAWAGNGDLGAPSPQIISPHVTRDGIHSFITVVGSPNPLLEDRNPVALSSIERTWTINSTFPVLGISPDSRYLAVATYPPFLTLFVFDLQSGQRIAFDELDDPMGFGSVRLGISAGGRLVVARYSWTDTQDYSRHDKFYWRKLPN